MPRSKQSEQHKMDTDLALNILSDHGYSINHSSSIENDEEYDDEADDSFDKDEDSNEDLEAGYAWNDRNNSSKLFRTEDEAIADCLSNIDENDLPTEDIEELEDCC